MKFKDIIIPVGLALITTWAIQYFFFGGSGNQQEKAQAGQVFNAPKSSIELKPRNTEIDFNEAGAKEATLSKVETHGARMTFSTYGASLEALEFKQISKGAGSLKTISMTSENERHNRAFLVAFDKESPYFYELESRQDSDDKVELVYKADFNNGTIRKKFIVYKHTYKIDVELVVSYKNKLAQAPTLRMFFPSPLVTELSNDDTVNALANNEKGAIVKTPFNKLDIEQGRFSPSIFGTDDRYFIHAMIDDASRFVSRAYYKDAGKKILISILEGPQVDPKKDIPQDYTWKVSFYFGPKEECAIAAVDPTLEQTLDYSGILAPISKFLLYVLKLLYLYLKNFGLAIIAMTILIKLILLPFTYRAEQSMRDRVEFDKKLKYVQQKFKDNPEQLAVERAELIKKHGLPGISGCLPLLLQIPIFFALSRVLSSSIELYRAPFLWIPDLSARDPYYILPILTALTMAFQAAATPGSDPKQRVSTLVMALVIGAITVSLASGLALYIWVFTFLGVIQTPLIRIFKRNG